MCWVYFLLSVWCLDPSDLTRDAASVEWMSGKKFEWALDQPVVATWQNAELRVATRALSEQRQVPVIFDRRLDPNLMFSLVTRSEPLRDVWLRLAKIVDGGVSITSQTVYLGPISAAGKLRTLIALRQDEIQQLATKLPTSQRSALNARHPLRWDDLTSPRDIVQGLAEERDLQVKGLELIPHDLWGATDLPPVSLAEAATLVLIQYDLTFRLSVAGKVVEMELLPIPEMVAIEKKWPLPRAKADVISQAIQSELPGITTQATAEQLLARGTQEQLESLERIINSISSGTTSRKKPAPPAPLSKRRFTFQAKDAPLSAILDKLAETGIQFEYDRAALKAQGIDIDQLAAVDVKDVSPEELFEKLFQPLKIEYKIDGLRISLTRRKSSP